MRKNLNFTSRCPSSLGGKGRLTSATAEESKHLNLLFIKYAGPCRAVNKTSISYDTISVNQELQNDKFVSQRQAKQQNRRAHTH